MRKRNTIRIAASVMAVILILLPLFKIQTFGETSKVKETEDKVLQISEEEKKNLELLFTINQKQEELQKQEVETEKVIEQLNTEKEKLESEALRTAGLYNKQRDSLGKILAAYERKGTASYLDAILSSGDLKTFIRSVNIVRDLTRGVNKLLSDLKENEKKLAKEKKKLADKIEELEKEKENLSIQIEKQKALKKSQEEFLASLKEERNHYESQLELLKASWESAKSYFKEGFVKDFEEKMQNGTITDRDLNLHIDLLKISGELKADKLNEALTPMAFLFEEGKAVMQVPEWSLTLTGTFEIKDASSLVFKIDGGTYYELPLEEGAVKELFPEGFPVIDLSSLLQNLRFKVKLEKIQLREGVMEFTLRPEL